jgi:hypothetical protein
MPINSYRMLTSKRWPRIPQNLWDPWPLLFMVVPGNAAILAALAGGMPALPGFLLFGE